jgi:hypothetical protein
VTERAALKLLRSKHSYLLFELRQKDERFTSIFTTSGRRMTCKPAVAIKLVVPEKSVLGREIVAMRKRKKTRAK